MRGLGIFGVVLVIVGAVVVALKGISYTRDKEEARLGPISIAAEEKGFITPLAGVVAIGAGALLIFTDRQKKRA